MDGLSVFKLSQLGLRELLIIAKSDPSDDSRAMNEVVNRFWEHSSRVAREVCYHSRFRDDVAGVALYAVVAAARSCDPDRDGLVGYILTAMRNAGRRESLRLLRQEVAPPEVRAMLAHEMAIKTTTNVIEPTRLSPFGDLTDEVAALPIAEQQAVVLMYLEDLTGAEVATRQHVRAPAVSKRLKAARERIARAVAA